jgi:hypothetical protein
MGSAAKSAGKFVTGGGAAGMLGGSFLKGSDKTYGADALAGNVNATGKLGLDNMRKGAEGLNKFYDNPQATIDNQIGIENKLLRGASNDAIRRTQSLIAQRGMGGSSIGLGQQVNQAKNLNEKLAMNNASGMQRMMDLNKDRINVGTSLYAPKNGQGAMQMTPITQRQGGFGQLFGTLAGAGLGAMAGGPAGAGVGSQLGGQLGGYYQNS